MRHPERRERAAKAWENDLERLRLRSRAARQARKKTNSEKREKQLHLRSSQFESLLKEPQLCYLAERTRSIGMLIKEFIG
jgi:hypothetical protein